MNTQTEPSSIAAIDLGSNSFHLLIGRFISGHFQILGKEKIRVQLAQGLGEDFSLDEASIERGLEALKQINERLKDISADDVRIVATYTLRKAKNAREFLRQARRFLPCPIEVISGSEEARLIYQGVAHTQPGKEQRLVIDIGGGSTECIIGQGFSPLRLNSLEMGCVTLAEKYFAEQELTTKRFKKAEMAAAQQIDPIATQYQRVGWKQVFGCSGTIKAVAYCLEQLGFTGGEITADGLAALKKTLCEDSQVSNDRFEQIAPERARVLPSGLAILIALFDTLKIDSMMLSEAALREGLVYEMEERMRHHDIRERTAVSLVERYHVDQAQAARVQSTAVALYQAVKAPWLLAGKKLKPLLNWAALLHEVGISIHFKGFQRHGAYILANTALPGFNAEEQQLVAAMVLHHRKRLVTELPALTLFEDQDQVRLIMLLRIATLLHLHRSEDQPVFEPTAEDDKLTLCFDHQWLCAHPLLEERLIKEVKEWARVDMQLAISTNDDNSR
ncbi:exopolyphosphatase [Corallincola platygyrae]|uniref:Exopolyphosphatase n=1 Tax=Corallincola platygyrae TaxID=1193278 RepID=A0ABW4XIR5_9GAMM